MKDESRRKTWQRNKRLETWLAETEALLLSAQEEANTKVGTREMPQVFVIGAPRSGTTLLMQWLAASGEFAYPTNWLSRFYGAPAIGMRIQQLFNDPELNFRDELADLAPKEVGYQSSLGKTKGALAPNEFWYFWRRFLPTVEIEPLGARTKEVDQENLRLQLASVSDAAGKPFAAKGMMLQYDLGFFAQALPNAVFLHVRRDGVSNANSLLRARRDFFDSEAEWYSAKPPEFESLAKKSPEEQVIGQVYWTQHHIDAGLATLPANRYLQVDYAQFCAEPAQTHTKLWERLKTLFDGGGGSVVSKGAPEYTGPAEFRCSDLGPGDIGASEPLTKLSHLWQALTAQDPQIGETSQ